MHGLLAVLVRNVSHVVAFAVGSKLQSTTIWALVAEHADEWIGLGPFHVGEKPLTGSGAQTVGVTAASFLLESTFPASSVSPASSSSPASSLVPLSFFLPASV